MSSWALWPRFILSRMIQGRRLKTRRSLIEERTTLAPFTLGHRRVVAGDLASNGWCFVEDVLSPDSHTVLCNRWPSLDWFDSLTWSRVGKCYDTLRVRRELIPASLTPVPSSISELCRVLDGEEFRHWIKSLSNSTTTLVSIHKVASVAYSHSFLTPHKDSLDSQNPHQMFNLIYFVNASGKGWDAGGTSILGDGTFRHAKFVPQLLKNTALIYDTRADFWHGFPRMPLRSWRWVVTTVFEQTE